MTEVMNQYDINFEGPGIKSFSVRDVLPERQVTDAFSEDYHRKHEARRDIALHLLDKEKRATLFWERLGTLDPHDVGMYISTIQLVQENV